MQVTTGGADPANATPGVQLNFVLRSGTSKWRGTTRYYFENNSLQSDNVSSRSLRRRSPATTASASTRTGASRAAGRSCRDRFFAWGAYGKTEPEIRVFSFDSGLNDYAQIARDATIAREHLGQGHRRGLVEDARQLHLLPRQQAEVRPRRVAASVPTRRPTTRTARRTCSRSRSTRRSAPTCSSSAATRTRRTGSRSSRAAARDAQSYRDDSQRRITGRTAGRSPTGRRTTCRSTATCSRAGTT